MKVLITIISLILVFGVQAKAQPVYEKDSIKTSAGDLGITFLGHGTLMMTFGGKVIHFDPWGKMADYATLPKADIVFLTHEHYDHLDLPALQAVRTKETVVVLTAKSAGKVSGGIVLKNGDVKIVQGIKVEAVPAYNLVHKRDSGQFFHPKGDGNGYVLTFGDKRVYVAGDTENIPEMKALKHIDIAFLPMNLPYTMTPEMVADAAKAFRPKILYPYHYGETDTSKIVQLLKANPEIEIRIRNMK